jgi:phosphohistidine phosphatase
MASMRKEARGLARLGVVLDVVLTSPLVRARQTAELVAGGLEPRPPIVNVESLTPDGSYAAVVADLEKHARKKRIALVGHEPAIGELAARLIGSRHSFEFKKGAVCRIDVEAIPPSGPGTLRWLLTPRVLRAVRK